MTKYAVKCKKLNVERIKMQRVDIWEGIFAHDLLVIIAKDRMDLRKNTKEQLVLSFCF